MLTSNITSLTYAVAKAHHERDTLVTQTARLDDRIAAMQSDERLAAIARKLGMRDPQLFALVKLPPAQAHRSAFPVLDSIAGWFAPSGPRAETR